MKFILSKLQCLKQDQTSRTYDTISLAEDQTRRGGCSPPYCGQPELEAGAHTWLRPQPRACIWLHVCVDGWMNDSRYGRLQCPRLHAMVWIRPERPRGRVWANIIPTEKEVLSEQKLNQTLPFSSGASGSRWGLRPSGQSLHQYRQLTKRQWDTRKLLSLAMSGPVPPWDSASKVIITRRGSATTDPQDCTPQKTSL